MSSWVITFAGLAAVLVMMTGVWIASLRQHDVSLVDRFWGLAFVVLVWVYALLGDGWIGRRLLLAGLVTVWGLRLAIYITWRNWGEGEDPRYAAMRAKDPDGFPRRSLVTVFWGQAVLAWIIAAPLFYPMLAETPDGFVVWDWLGVTVWAIGLFFEAVGDWQLSRFLADPANRGKVMDRGLWRFTRHPNYFGDVTLWWGYWLVAVAAGAWWSAYGSLLMTVFIIKVSGVALTERNMARKSRREGYEEYVQRTSAFFPLPPKKA